MAHQRIDGMQFLHMMQIGSRALQKQVELVNSLNVFPVPDGDTGSNMSLTLSTGVDKMIKSSDWSIAEQTEQLSKGLLMGARGNSGVILSQLFRGFAKAARDKEVLNVHQFADAFQQGVETAYKAVMKPVEGTILTIAREAAEEGMRCSWNAPSIEMVLEAMISRAQVALDKTVEQLPALKQAGVVDAGGKGLVIIYEGMLAALQGHEEELKPNETEMTPPRELPPTEVEEPVIASHAKPLCSDPASIRYGYCTEFLIQRNTKRRKTEILDEEVLKRYLSRIGDSLLVIADDDWVKVHIHVDYPGDALNYGMRFGDLSGIKIDNMREQVEEIASSTKGIEESVKATGLVAVASGDGIADIFSSMGVDVIIEGGQTMNPSTEEIAARVKEVSAERIIILPNNKNIIMAAEQVAELVDTPITVIPTRTIPQGIAALVAWETEADFEVNVEKMHEAFSDLISGELTYAVRDTKINDITIAKDNYIGIREGEIEVAGQELVDTAIHLLQQMITDESEVLSIFYGKEVSEETAQQLCEDLQPLYPDLECEVYYGGQPLYYFLFSVE